MAFSTDKLYEAAYLEGVHDKKCTRIEDDPNRPGRYLFHFDLLQDEGERLVLMFGSSESCRYDDSVKRFKTRLAEKTRGTRRY